MRQLTTMLFDRAYVPTRKTRSRLGFITVFASLIICQFTGIAQPKWAGNFPSILSGASSADISVQLSEPGTVYFTVYSSAPSGLTASKIKEDAISSIGGLIVRNGRITVSQANASITTYLSGMSDNTTYYFSLVAEGASSGLQADAEIKTITKVFPSRHTSNSFRSKFGPNALIGYMAYVPEAYYKDPNAKFPILLMLHGMGEKVWNPSNTSQLNLVRQYGPAMLIDKGKEFPFIVITPQCPFPGWDDVSTDGFRTTTLRPGEFVNEIYDMMEANYRVDKNKEYLTGISMGGASVWTYLSKPFNRIAAAIPIAGWADPTTAPVMASQNIAIWSFQGGNDGAGGIQNVVNSINNNRPAIPAKSTIFPGVGHNAWDMTYNNSGPGIAPDNIYDWLMRYSRNVQTVQAPNSAPIASAGSDQTITLPTNSITLNGSGTDKDGTIASYVWTQKTGTTAKMTGSTTPNLGLTDLTAGPYSFQLTVKDDKGAESSSSVAVTIMAAPVANGNGLTAQLYNNMTLGGSPLSTQIDPTINFAWGDGAPKGLNTDRFSVRWTGAILPKYSETYTFYTSSDDGVRLSVNGQLIVNNWTDHATTTNTGTVTLKAGTKYEIKMEFYDNCCSATATLAWSSATQTKEIVPNSQLFPTFVPDTQPIPSPVGTGLSADYFNNMSLAGTPTVSRVDPSVSFLWTGAPASSINQDRFSVRWSGQVLPKYSEKYTFYTSSDDGVRLWVNDVLLVDNWSDHGSTTNSGTIDLQAGQQYTIKMEYYENTCDAEAKLFWSCANIAKQIVPNENLFPTGQEYLVASAGTSNVSMYPVPATSILNVSFSASNSGDADIKILDDLTQVKQQNTIIAQQGTNIVTLDVSSIPNGIYTLVVTTSDKIQSSRLLITK